MAVKATFSAEFGSFYTAVEKAEAKLTSFETGAKDVEKALTRMGDSIAGRKIVHDATLMAQAIENTGGIAMLTGKQLQRFGAQAAEAMELMRKRGQDVPPAFQAISDAANKSSGVMGILTSEVGKMAAGFVTGQAIIGAATSVWHSFTDVLSGSIKAAGDAETAHVQLVAALRAQGTAVPSVIAAFQGYADALQKTTIYQDDAIEGAAALLVQVGNVMPRDMQKALEATTNLASGLGVDLHTAVLMVSKAAEGNIAGLKKAGVTMDETAAKAGGFGFVLDEINKKFAGQAEAIAGTYEGRLKQLGNTWNNVQESIGRVITENSTVLKFFDLLNKEIIQQTGELNQNSTATNLVSDAVIMLIRAVGELAPLFGKAALAAEGLYAVFIEFSNIGIQVAADLDTAAIAALKAQQKISGGLIDTSKEIKFYQDDLAELQKRGDANVQSFGRFYDSVHAFSDGMNSAGSVADRLAAQLAETRGQTAKLKDATDNSADAWTRHTKRVDEAAEAAKAAADAFEKWLKFINFGPALHAVHQIIGKVHELKSLFNGTSPLLGDGIPKLTTDLTDLGDNLTDLGKILVVTEEPLIQFGGGLDRLAAHFREVNRQNKEAADRIKQFYDFVARPIDLSQIGGALQEGQAALAASRDTTIDWGKALEAVDQIVRHIPGRIGEIASQAVEAGRLIKDIANDTEGAMTLGVSFVATAWINVFAEIAAAKRKVEDTNDMRDAFIWALGPNGAGGTLKDLQERANKAGIAIKDMLRARTVQEFTAEVNKLNDRLSEMDRASDDLVDVEDKYHLSLTKTGSELFKNFKILEAGGNDADRILHAMSGDFSRLVSDAKKFGLAVPEALRPLLERLVKMGELTDIDGNKLDDLNGITFTEVGDSGEKNFDRMTAAVDRLVAMIKLTLGLALDETEQKLLGINQLFQNLGRPRDPTNPILGPAVPRPEPEPPPVAVPRPPTAEAFARAGLLSNVLPFRRPSTLAGWAASGGEDTVINITTTLDGKVIAENTTRHQTNTMRNRGTTRAS